MPGLLYGGQPMTIYLTQEGGDQAKVDEIEDKLKSTIPDLKRVASVEDIDRRSSERSIILLVLAPPQGSERRRSDRRCQALSAKHVLHHCWRRHFRARL